LPGTVTVACKLPSGLVLQLFRMEDHDEPLMSGGFRTVQRAVPLNGKQVKLNGSARRHNKDADHTIVAGAGLTYNVDADFFAEWQKQNAGAPYASQVYASVKSGDPEAWAKEHRAMLTGFERHNPDKPTAEFATIKTGTREA